MHRLMAFHHYLSHIILLFFFLIYPSLVPAAESSERKNITEVKVGVILDTSSWIGGLSWSCMKLAAEDFYASHPNYTSKLSLVLRDLRSDRLSRPDTEADAFGAAVAALDLLKNVQVQAIIGPQTSTQAKFVLELGNKSKVPIISFSAQSPSMSPSQTSYFFQTSWSDSSQAAAIASIVQFFNWTEVVPVFEDNDYGNMFQPYLVEALQGVDARVPYRCKLPYSASNSEIYAALNYLEANTTRVFVVHMSYEPALQFFALAKERNLMKSSFVWITTYGLTDIVDILGSNAGNVMQGVLGIRPFVPEIQRLSTIFRKKYYEQNRIYMPTAPTVSGLWAYDTVWLLGKAIEDVKHENTSFEVSTAPFNSSDFLKIGVSEMGSKLKASLESTNFTGISGKFQLVNHQLQSRTFEITNVVDRQNKRVGFCTKNSISKQMDMTVEINGTIIWPGNKNSTPKGWQWPTNRAFRIGVPSKPGFSEFLLYDNKTHKFDGYCIKVFNAVMDQLPFHDIRYEFHQYINETTQEQRGSYDDLIYEVYLQKYDAVVGDVTILANRSLYVDFTLPYTESGVRMLVPIKDINEKSPWAFLEPLTINLWLTTGAFLLLTGITVWIIEHRVNPEFRGNPANQMGSIFYFAFSTLVFAHRERLVSNLSRLVVITWVFVVLVLQQSYTASLTSKLTVEQLQATVTNIEQVVKAGSKVGYLEDSFMPGLLKRLGVNESKMIPLSSPQEYNEALSNGTVTVILDEIPYLKVFLKKYPRNYSMVGPIYKSDGFGFVFPKGSPLVPDVSRAILKVMESPNMTKFDQQLYGNDTFTDKEDTTSSTSLTFHSFMGLFLLTGISSSLALIIHVLFSIHQRHNNSTRNETTQNPLQKDEQRAEELTDCTMASPNSSDSLEATIISLDSVSDFEESIDEEGTLGRQVANNEIEVLPSGEMLNQTREGTSG